MVIFKAKNRIDEYKLKALSNDINELSGRTGREDLTAFVNEKILEKIKDGKGRFVDLGCGDAILLKLASKNQRFNELIGILPNKEEVDRVSIDLQKNHLFNKITILQGLSDKTILDSNSCNVIIINGVILLLDNIQHLRRTIQEINRIAAKDAIIYLGEVPFVNEGESKKYGDSIIKWLIHVLLNDGILEFIIRFKQVLTALISKEPFIISKKEVLFIEEKEFIKLLNEYGLKVQTAFIHREVSKEGKEFNSQSRMNYIAIKP